MLFIYTYSIIIDVLVYVVAYVQYPSVVSIIVHVVSRMYYITLFFKQRYSIAIDIGICHAC